MTGSQTYEPVEKVNLFDVLWLYKQKGWRLAQISATTKESYDILYSIEKDYDMIHLRLDLAQGESLDSITGIFPYAYLYENELKDLFGIDILGLSVDFEGNLYQFSTDAPFGIKKVLPVVDSQESEKDGQ